jgi:hypothetical protein
MTLDPLALYWRDLQFSSFSSCCTTRTATTAEDKEDIWIVSDNAKSHCRAEDQRYSYSDDNHYYNNSSRESSAVHSVANKARPLTPISQHTWNPTKDSVVGFANAKTNRWGNSTSSTTSSQPATPSSSAKNKKMSISTSISTRKLLPLPAALQWLPIDDDDSSVSPELRIVSFNITDSCLTMPSRRASVENFLLPNSSNSNCSRRRSRSSCPADLGLTMPSRRGSVDKSLVPVSNHRRGSMESIPEEGQAWDITRNSLQLSSILDQDDVDSPQLLGGGRAPRVPTRRTSADSISSMDAVLACSRRESDMSTPSMESSDLSSQLPIRRESVESSSTALDTTLRLPTRRGSPDSAALSSSADTTLERTTRIVSVVEDTSSSSSSSSDTNLQLPTTRRRIISVDAPLPKPMRKLSDPSRRRRRRSSSTITTASRKSCSDKTTIMTLKRPTQPSRISGVDAIMDRRSIIGFPPISPNNRQNTSGGGETTKMPITPTKHWEESSSSSSSTSSSRNRLPSSIVETFLKEIFELKCKDVWHGSNNTASSGDDDDDLEEEEDSSSSSGDDAIFTRQPPTHTDSRELTERRYHRRNAITAQAVACVDNDGSSTICQAFLPPTHADIMQDTIRAIQKVHATTTIQTITDSRSSCSSPPPI